MAKATITSILAFLTLLSYVGSSPLRSVGSSWLKSHKSDADSLKEKLVTCRGGSTDSQSGEKKIKGVCVGIDLGTTYR
jgi:hypothetical protein